MNQNIKASFWLEGCQWWF